MAVPEHHLGFMSEEEYLKTEETSPIRREFVNGQIFAMTGTTLRHNLICHNLQRSLWGHQQGGPCKTFVESVKVKIAATRSFYYPDVMVTCKEVDTKSVYIESPVLIVEVLSESTAPIDKREKLIAYCEIDALREYILVHQDKRAVTVYRKIVGERWGTPEIITGKGVVSIRAMPGKPLEFSLEEIYDGVGGDTPQDGYQVREAELEYAWY